MHYRSPSFDRDAFPGGSKVEAGYNLHVALLYGVSPYKSTVTSEFFGLTLVFDIDYPIAETMMLPMIDELKKLSFRLLYCRRDSVSDGVYHERIAMQSMQKNLVAMRRTP
ncbi:MULTISPECIES: hypothetical protein [Mesorhizobium]|uniref:hypothetical protein n=1 Tax=Mesorhizobium TaxID=68287 RepID=UPI0007ED3634|nr:MULTISPECIES: hypothetical protein [Mesorhizobium]TPJ45938.1 hypothetical protein FJ437_14635 [Mesorhizobium sp. B2-6-6]ARP67257.1 hypothetical protein A9K65_030925 [Mesorhizobium sp. WSM1497]MCA0002848.1 hypothetical protein [Mesorhizobium sp. B264B2A]MCA0008421.1 hypothetical protein [Mesorhizobium sp. B264B1B]MCA0014601.1 hypothetical protein [Mesorhizobium sp. B294B1A1]